MNVYMRRAARLYVFKRTSRVPNGLIFFCSEQVFLPQWHCHTEGKPWRRMGACCLCSRQAKGHIVTAHRVQRAQDHAALLVCNCDTLYVSSRERDKLLFLFPLFNLCICLFFVQAGLD